MTDSPTREDALLPCPFCPDGGEPYLSEDRHSKDGIAYLEAGCNKCGVHLHYVGPIDGAKAMMSSKWNTRAGIVIDRDKVPHGLKEAIEWVQTGVRDGLLPDEMNHAAIMQAAALLAEKVEE